jgi:hypothetical protein
MHAKNLILIATASAAAVTALSVVPAAVASQPAAKGQGKTLTLKVYEVEDQYGAVPPSGSAVGDYYALSSTIYTKPGGTTLGHTGVTCIETNTGGPTYECSWSISLTSGEFTAVGLVDAVDLVKGGSWQMPIFGGTGSYTGALGVATVHVVNNAVTKFDDQFSLTLPSS